MHYPHPERHELEQYWFAESTLRLLSTLVLKHRNVVGLCCPMLGQYMVDNGHRGTMAVLDADTRFHEQSWVMPYDLYRPEALVYRPGLLIIDPPFTRVRLDTLWNAVGILTQKNFRTRMVISWPRKRSAALLGTFHQYGLQASSFKPEYASAMKLDVGFYSNFWGL